MENKFLLFLLFIIFHFYSSLHKVNKKHANNLKLLITLPVETMMQDFLHVAS